MSSDELQELHEHAEHAHHDPSMAPVSLTMAVLAVVVATVSLLGHRTHTEEIVFQNKASDEWAYYQAKSIRRHVDQTFVDLSSLMATKDSAETARLAAKYADEAKRYNDEQKELQAEATRLEDETHLASRKADRYDLSEVFLEIALVITSITLLSKRRAFWYGGIVLGILGAAIALTGIVLH
jgi:Skp family chaperone for outer membrane proteins